MFIIFDKISNISRNIFSISAKIFEISYAFFYFYIFDNRIDIISNIHN